MMSTGDVERREQVAVAEVDAIGDAEAFGVAAGEV